MRKYTLLFFLMILILLPLVSFSAPTVELAVPAEGEYYLWFVYKDINQNNVSTIPKKFSDKTVTVELPLVKDKPVKSMIHITNYKTGNKAIKELNPGKNDYVKISLQNADFNYINKIGFTITAADNMKPASSAKVTLETENYKLTQMLTPVDSGLVYFNDVPIGVSKIIVEYDAGKSASQDVEINAERQTTVPTYRIPIAGDIETGTMFDEEVSESEGTKASDNKPDRETSQDKESGFNIGNALIGIILFAALIYFAFRFLQSKGIAVKSVLKNAGIDLPEDAGNANQKSEQSAPVDDPNICKFCGDKKDPATGNCRCSVYQPKNDNVSVPIANPKLIAISGPYMGTIFSLDAETVTIGRDESNAISLSIDNTVSRSHAKIINNSGAYSLIDTNSSNGVFVNGSKIDNVLLRSGDEIRIGNSAFKFEN